ncbi:hypothetical protein [Achromobacter spanius]|uniref:Transmembrane protein n=1 Tax=Achromobacter spanius TaxID=217203 RepID=A0AAW3HZ47_9BURK|nr:hypothetical protein [Achromobacter spanius]KNE25829.1 hypothetical protein AFM18_20615 [Achromobacter spanius]
MPTPLLTLLRCAGYWITATLGAMIHYGFVVPWQWILRPLSGTPFVLCAFVMVARSRVRPWLGMLVAVGVISAALAFTVILDQGLNAWAAVAVTLGAVTLGRLLHNHHGRILVVSNQGRGIWSVHLNLLKAKHPTPLWRGVFRELENVVRMAKAAGAVELRFTSPLLVNDTTVGRLDRKLRKALSKCDLTAEVTLADPKPMGVGGTGLIHVYLARQRGLKATRQVYEDAPWNIKTRAITFQITPAPHPFPPAEPQHCFGGAGVSQHGSTQDGRAAVAASSGSAR